MRKLKILFMIPRLGTGGTERQLYELVKGIDKNRFDVTVGTFVQKSDLEDDFTKLQGVKVISFDKKGKIDIKFYFRVSAYIKANDIDVVQAFLCNRHVTFASIGLKKCKVFWSFRISLGNIPFKQRFMYGWVDRLISLIKCDYIVSNSDDAKKEFVQCGYNPKTICVVYSGIADSRIEVTKSKADIRNNFNINNDCTIIGTIGRLVEQKDYYTFLRMAQILLKSKKNLVFVIVGDGLLLNEIQRKVVALNLHERVIFTGKRVDIGNFLNIMDVFCHTSLYEGFPNVVGEAMLAGLPTVSTDVGDVNKMIEDGKNGFLVQPGEAEKIAERVNTLLDNKALAKEFSENAAKTIKKNFSVTKMVSEYEKIYSGIMNKKQ